ncbi:hypothetical protein LUZ60_016177 [Juncus effusus]|nr:hypothetical protein LUZ60_016177 [Juncus effusus]
MEPFPLSRSASALDSSASISHSLSSILNNPSNSYSSSSSSAWPSFPFFSQSLPDPPISTPLPSTPFPEISLSNFAPYLSSISDTFSKFEDIINHSNRENRESSPESDSSLRPGEALLACLREVPSLFFKESFELEDGATFHMACPFSPNQEENLSLQEKLTQYLDVVEMGLVREIALRSESFYEAQGRLGGLDGEIVEACGRIRGLKETIRVLTGDLVGSARQVQELNETRGGLVSLQQKLTVILCVSKEMSDLKLLVAQADCVAALDVIDDLQHLLDTDELTGLHCFRHLRDQLATSLDSVNSILSAEFVRNAVPDLKSVEEMVVLTVKRKDSSLLNGIEHDENLEGENADLEARLLPLLYCLSRTAKLPAVLRIYRDTLITVMKAAIKTTVAELLPILVAKPFDCDSGSGDRTVDSDAGGQSLASKLRNLSPDSFVQLLAAIFKIVQVHLKQAAEVKRVVENGMLNIYGGFSTGTESGTDESANNNNINNNNLHSQNSYKNSQKLAIQGKPNDSSSPSSSKNFRADVLRENTEAVFSACDAAHQRWAKLLGVRALLHPRLRLPEFLSIFNLTQDFISSTEKIGGRLGYSIRGTLQSQSKAFVDFQHDSRMTKIKAVMDQETWTAVEVPEEFQAIVNSLSSSTSSVENNTVELVRPESTGEEIQENGTGEEKITESSSPVQSTGPSQSIVHGGVSYHMVNCGLILLKMLAEYVDISKCLPNLSSEIVQRVVEILKLFNTRTCQLVLGAGAMQVSGLKSISSKHLALASQIITFIFAIIPDVRRVLFMKIPETCKPLLASEFDRVAQDYKIHRDEIQSKLVQIMRDRLLANLRNLLPPQIAERWNSSENNNSSNNDLQPSQFAKSVTKEVNFLHRILSQTMLEADVQSIFRQVVQDFHTNITDAYSKLDIKTPQANNRLCRDVQHILACIRKLPSEKYSDNSVPNYGLLDEFLAEKFGSKVAQ